MIRHRLFVPSPSRLAGPLAPLVVALHGCTQTASDFAAGTRFDSVAERYGAYVLYPEQTTASNPNRCWNWFLRSHQFRESGEPAAIVDLVRETIARNPIDPERVFVCGLSAGGAMSAILAEQAPDVFAAAGVMAGVSLHTSYDVTTAFAAMHGRLAEGRVAPYRGASGEAYDRLRVAIWTGIEDKLVSPGNATLLSRQFRSLMNIGGVTADRVDRRDAEVSRWHDATGRSRVELWHVPLVGHAWSGGSFRGSHTDPRGPRASDEMMAFFLDVPEGSDRFEDSASLQA